MFETALKNTAATAVGGQLVNTDASLDQDPGHDLARPKLDAVGVIGDDIQDRLGTSPQSKLGALTSFYLSSFSPVIGTELIGIDLRQLTNRQKDELALLVAERGIVFFRDQELSIHEQLDVGSPGMQVYLEGLTALHSAVAQADGYRTAGLHVCREPVESVHPVVRVHPVTGWKSVYVNPGFTLRILGIPKPKSDTILNSLFHQITNNVNFHMCFYWEPNSVTFWDNRRNHEAQQVAKVCRQEEEEAASRACEEIRDNAAVNLDDNDNLIQRSPSPPVYRLSGLPNCRRRLPKRFCDDLPPMPIVVPPSNPNDVVATVPDPNQYNSDHAITVTTVCDLYGIYREYSHSIPSFNPDNFTSVAHISNAPTFTKSQDSTEARPWWSGFGKLIQSNQTQFFSPFLNATTFRLMQWFYGGSSMKSLGELDHLVDEVILADDFDKAHLVNFRAVKEAYRLDSHQGDPQDVRSSFSAGDGWMETTVKICLPADGVKHDSESMAPEFEVPGPFYQ
ncbi:uncharacterized protein F5891DRAFT_1231982 [Suillus fuscotomentosus]|uniref:TauD/TfdA-like domain-containing protein n=1 Tax=Suillus fuscotomentosus TaxID=1912939 RepID=A0AAD4E501_9AGAM|nr:uncharacterized protein F5891DRAFT_1231982 [Suillus fuscotomentosus]KAG1899830.1 hypothetical protein F5891DRAFT_1231982 [Suillus fuscotomentosus]